MSTIQRKILRKSWRLKYVPSVEHMAEPGSNVSAWGPFDTDNWTTYGRPHSLPAKFVGYRTCPFVIRIRMITPQNPDPPASSSIQ